MEAADAGESAIIWLLLLRTWQPGLARLPCPGAAIVIQNAGPLCCGRHGSRLRALRSKISPASPVVKLRSLLRGWHLPACCDIIPGARNRSPPRHVLNLSGCH
jgi:hypothetical protein